MLWLLKFQNSWLKITQNSGWKSEHYRGWGRITTDSGAAVSVWATQQQQKPSQRREKGTTNFIIRRLKFQSIQFLIKVTDVVQLTLNSIHIKLLLEEKNKLININYLTMHTIIYQDISFLKT